MNSIFGSCSIHTTCTFLVNQWRYSCSVTLIGIHVQLYMSEHKVYQMSWKYQEVCWGLHRYHIFYKVCRAMGNMDNMAYILWYIPSKILGTRPLQMVWERDHCTSEVELRTWVFCSGFCLNASGKHGWLVRLSCQRPTSYGMYCPNFSSRDNLF